MASNIHSVNNENEQNKNATNLDYFNDWNVKSDNIKEYEKDPSVFHIYKSDDSSSDEEFTIDISNDSKDGPMDSAWPMQGQNVRHTCLSPFSTENNTGAEKWRVSGDYRGEVESSAIVDRNGTIYFGTMGPDHSLYALYPNGTRKWRFHANDLIWSTPAIAGDGTIYIPTWGSNLVAIDQNGDEKWIFNTEDSVGSSVTIGENDTVYIGTMGGFLFAINPNGSEQWRLYLGGNLISTPTIGIDNIIYIGTTSHYLYAVNPNGSVRWQFEAGQFKGTSSISSDGTIYAPSFDGNLYALYPNGTLKWQASTGSSIAAAGVAIASDGTIYVGTEQLRAYYPNGTLKWITDLQGDIYGTVPAISSDGTIYVSAVCDLVAVNPDGSERWRRIIADTWTRSSPSIGADGTVYVGSTWGGGVWLYGYLHAFGNGSSNVPIAPTINGQTNGKIKKTYTYTFTSSSPLEKDIYYLIDWGDGTVTDWLGSYNSGETLTISHSWEAKGTYMIKARAKDTDNRWGPWGTLSVTMPCSYQNPFMNFLERILERFPHAFPLLRYLLEQ